jgi:predicted amidohydrolase YtcJ
MATFYAAVVRKDKGGKPEGGWQKENALSREDALHGMTIWAAIANFEDHHKGSLEVGKYADFVMLDRDIMQVEEGQLLQTVVLKTILAGEIVYDKLLADQTNGKR